MVTEVKDLGKEKSIKILPEIEDVSKAGKGTTEAVEYIFPYRRTALVKVGDKVKKGDIITDGSASIDDVFEYGGEERAKNYVIAEVGKIYELQGETVSRKHIEIIVKQMFSRRRVTNGGDTNLTDGMIVDEIQLSEENEAAKVAGGSPAKVEKLVMGITETSLSRKSFLSAASFQHTTRVLISNAIRGSEDDLSGLMENVIIGHLVPAGSGFPGSPKKKMIDAIAEKYVGTGEEH
jgi:DNA-directed RNA polymerase subunit beta'